MDTSNSKVKTILGILFILFLIYQAIGDWIDSQDQPVQPLVAHYDAQESCITDFKNPDYCSVDFCSSIEVLDEGNGVCSVKFYWSPKRETFVRMAGSSRFVFQEIAPNGPVNAKFISEEGKEVMDL
jgi:hypothetical protein